MGRIQVAWRLPRLFWRAYRLWDREDCIDLSAAFAYHTLQSLFPILLIALGVASRILGRVDGLTDNLLQLAEQFLPSSVLPFRVKLFGLTIHPERLREIREERRPGSKYAALDSCRYEVREAEAMMVRERIPMLNTTTKSIEEIATTILQEIRPERLSY